MVLALYFRERVAHRGQKIVVRGDDRAIEFKLDDRLDAIERREHRLSLHMGSLRLGRPSDSKYHGFSSASWN